MLAKQIVTSRIVGVTLPFVVVNSAWYFRKRFPLNCANDVPLLVKNVAAVPSGPTKLNGPSGLLLAAAWNFSAVPAGTSAFHARLPHVAEADAGLASFTDDTN